MSSLYKDQEYLELTLKVIKDNIADMHKISVYNDDKYAEELTIIDEQIKKMEEKK